MKASTIIIGGVIAVVLIAFGAFFYKSWSPKTETIDLGAMPEARLNRFLALGDYLRARYDCYVDEAYAIDFDDEENAYDLIVAPLEALPIHVDQWGDLDLMLYEGGMVVTGMTDFDPSSGMPDQYASAEILQAVGIEDLGAVVGGEQELVKGRDDAGDYEFWSYFSPTFSEREAGAVYGAWGNVRTMWSLDTLDNDTIADAEHVLIFEALVADLKIGPETEVLIVHGRNVPSIWSWLFLRARGVLFLTVLMIGFVIWHFGPRFGPLIPEGERGTRELREHFTASARFLVRNRLSNKMLERARAPVLEALRRRAPTGADSTACIRLASELSNLPQEDVATALYSPEIPRGALTRIVATLQKLRTVL